VIVEKEKYLVTWTPKMCGLFPSILNHRLGGGNYQAISWKMTFRILWY